MDIETEVCKINEFVVGVVENKVRMIGYENGEMVFEMSLTTLEASKLWRKLKETIQDIYLIKQGHNDAAKTD